MHQTHQREITKQFRLIKHSFRTLFTFVVAASLSEKKIKVRVSFLEICTPTWVLTCQCGAQILSYLIRFRPLWLSRVLETCKVQSLAALGYNVLHVYQQNINYLLVEDWQRRLAESMSRWTGARIWRQRCHQSVVFVLSHFSHRKSGFFHIIILVV